MGFIEFLESTAVAVWVRESPSIFAYTTVLGMHAFGLAVVVGLSSAVALRSLGVAPGIPLAPMASLFPLMYVGFTINAVSGLMLFVANAGGMLTNTMFYVKMLFVIVAIVLVALLQHRFQNNEPENATGLCIAILACWFGAIVAGRLTAYPFFVEAFLGI